MQNINLSDTIMKLSLNICASWSFLEIGLRDYNCMDNKILKIEKKQNQMSEMMLSCRIWSNLHQLTAFREHYGAKVRIKLWT